MIFLQSFLACLLISIGTLVGGYYLGWMRGYCIAVEEHLSYQDEENFDL